MTNNKEESNKSTKLLILEHLTREETIHILQVLVKENPKLESRIEELTLIVISNVDTVVIASNVNTELDKIEIDEVWDRSGRTHLKGYIEPIEAADEILFEVLTPFTSRLKSYQILQLNSEAKKQYLGILTGIYQFYKESLSEFRDFADDIITEAFEFIRSEWGKWCKDTGLLRETDDFINDNLPDC